MLAVAFPDNPAARRGDAGDVGGGGGSRGVIPVFLATVFLFFVAYELFGVAAAAVVMALAVAAAFARGFPFLRMSLGGGGGSVARAVAGGMDAAAMMALPATFGYKRERDGGAHGEAAATAGAGWAQCAICIGLVRVGEAVRRLPSCGHLFHAGCVDEWLRAHATCPLCRAAVCAAAAPPPELPV